MLWRRGTERGVSVIGDDMTALKIRLMRKTRRRVNPLKRHFHRVQPPPKGFFDAQNKMPVSMLIKVPSGYSVSFKGLADAFDVPSIFVRKTKVRMFRWEKIDARENPFLKRQRRDW